MAQQAFLFDLDGTLWDSFPFYASLLEERGDESRKAALAGLRGGRPAAVLLRDAGVTPAMFRRRCADSTGPVPYPGVPETLEQLSDRGVPLGVVTNLPSWMVSPMLRAAAIDPLFDSVVHYGRARKPKPNPEPIRLALDELGVEPVEEVWYVGDSPSDCRAATEAGISFAWAAYGYTDQPPADCTARIREFSEVAEL